MSDNGQPVVALNTTEGIIKIELWQEKAPTTVDNFLQYLDEGFYDGKIFHRVIEDFMIQGGGFDPKMRQDRTRAGIPNEASPDKENRRGTIAMARTSDPHSASAQFFINVKDNEFLNHKAKTARGWGYCAFGEVVEGMDVVDRINEVPTHSVGGHDDVPVEPVVIESARRVDS